MGPSALPTKFFSAEYLFVGTVKTKSDKIFDNYGNLAYRYTFESLTPLKGSPPKIQEKTFEADSAACGGEYSQGDIKIFSGSKQTGIELGACSNILPDSKAHRDVFKALASGTKSPDSKAFWKELRTLRAKKDYEKAYHHLLNISTMPKDFGHYLIEYGLVQAKRGNYKEASASSYDIIYNNNYSRYSNVANYNLACYTALGRQDYPTVSSILSNLSDNLTTDRQRLRYWNLIKTDQDLAGFRQAAPKLFRNVLYKLASRYKKSSH